MAEASDTPELTALTARVAELERQVADLHAMMLAEPAPKPLPAKPLRVEAAPMPYIPLRAAAEPPPPPPLSQMQAQAAAQIPAQSQSLENRLGSQVFNIIAIVAIIIGTSLFLKLAIDRGWLGPAARVVIGMVAGAGLVLWSERFRRKGFAAFSYSLKALGSGVLYLSLWASFQLYHQLPAGVALLAMVLVTAWNGFMAWSQDSELLAAYGIVGGFATPLLLSTGGNHETFLFTYVAAIVLAVVLLNRWKPWQRLLLPTFAAMAGYFIGWYAKFSHENVRNTLDGESWETAAFAVLFFALFAAVSLKGFRVGETSSGETIVPVLLPLANAAFVSLALYSVLQDSGLHDMLPWEMVALASVYLGLARVQATAISGAIHLASAVIFLTIAIPLKASGHTLTVAWLVEGLVLYWASTRVEQESGAPAKVLSVLSLCGYALGLSSLAAHWLFLAPHASFFNHDLAASLIAVGVLAGAAWLAQQPPRRDAVTLVAALVAVDLVALLLAVREVALSPFDGRTHGAFANAEFVTALVGLIVLAANSYITYNLSKEPEFEPLLSVAGATLVLFNLVAILSIEREIGALWVRGTDDLQRSLAISGFLMLYGAGLLAAGFWKRNAFVRWQALILLLFTILKVFLYDISGLSQGYRVASFLGLGALLLGVSFAYQKDLLGLRIVTSPDEPDGEKS